MVEHTLASRKTLNEDRIAMCPQLGCESIKKIKPLKFGFLGFGKYPKCKNHHFPLVYVDERIGEIVDASLACLFDKSGLPPKNFLANISEKFPKELKSFINSWVYCIVIGRGGKIISSYMDTISKSYLKQFTKSQLKDLNSNKDKSTSLIQKGIDEITYHYERLLKHLRVHSEVLVDTKELYELSKTLRSYLKSWLKTSSEEISDLMKLSDEQPIPITQVKKYYDKILNLDICRSLIGLSLVEKKFKGRSVSAFDRFSKYFEFWQENLTQKFTKSDIEDLYKVPRVNFITSIPFTDEEKEFFREKKIEVSELKTRWVWVTNKEIAIEFYEKVILPKFDKVPRSHDVDSIGYRGFRASIRKLGLGMNDLTKAAGFNPYHEEKYKDMNYDDLLEFFEEIVYPEVKCKLLLEDGKAPPVRDLESKELGYRGFIERVRKTSKMEGIEKNIWAEFMKKAGLKPLKELRYQGMDFVELMDLYAKKIYPEIRNKFNLKFEQAPLKEQILKDNSSFITALRRKGQNLTDLHLALGFKLDYMAIYSKKSYKELKDFFKNVIQPTLFDIYEYSLNEAPSYEEVEEHYRGFLNALGRNKKKYSDVVKETGFIVRPSSLLGDLTHRAMNLLLTRFINQDKIPYNYYSEVELFLPSTKHRIDGLLFVSKTLLNSINFNLNVYRKANQLSKKEGILLDNFIKKLEKSNFLLIDFSNGFFKRGRANSELIARKILKYLGLPYSFLLCVGTNWRDKSLIRRLPASLNYKNKNVLTNLTTFINPTLLNVIFGFDFLTEDILKNIISYNIARRRDKLKKIIQSTIITKNLRIYSTDEYLKGVRKWNLNKWL
jgi:hypothetical protein